MSNQKKIAPVKVSKRFLNEGFLRAGQISFDFSKTAIKNNMYSGEGNSLPIPGDSLITPSQERNLRGAMILRALIDFPGKTTKVASIAEDLAAELLNGKQINSARFAGDNTTFADINVNGVLYSVKLRGKKTGYQDDYRRDKYSSIKTDHWISEINTRPNKVWKFGVAIVDCNEKGFDFIFSAPKEFRSQDFEKINENWYYQSQKLPKGIESTGQIASVFGDLRKEVYIIASANRINVALKAKNYDKNFQDFLYMLQNNDAKEIVMNFDIFSQGLGAAQGRLNSFMSQASKFVEDDDSGLKRNMIYQSSSVQRTVRDLMRVYDKIENEEKKEKFLRLVTDILLNLNDKLDTVKVNAQSGNLIGYPEVQDKVSLSKTKLGSSSMDAPFANTRRGPRMRLQEEAQVTNSISQMQNEIFKLIKSKDFSRKKQKLLELLNEAKKKRRRSKCRPARRRIASGGKAGSYADPRTGGKQAYAALKKAKPPGSKGGWTKKKCICCHKCPNDRSAPNGFVCTNPSHLYWGTKADNTYDQNRGNGWAARNKKKNEGDPNGEKAFAYELMVSEDKIRDAIKKILLEDAQSEAWFGNSFVTFKKEVSKGKDPLKVAKKNLNEIGRGSTRVVFDLPDNDGFVLKIINTEVEPTRQAFIGPDGNVMPNVSPEGDFRTRHGFFRSHMRQSNEWEADLIMQQKFPDVFPKTFEKADDFSWILVEKALPIATLDELINILGLTNTFSSFARNKKVQFIVMIKEAIEYFKNPDHRLRIVKESYDSTITGFDFDDKNNKETFSTDLFDVLPTQNNYEPPSDTVVVTDDEPYTPVEDPHDKRVKELISNAHNRKILGVMADLGIPPREFLPKNLGVSSLTGKLLIIDASLWEEKKKVR